MWRDFEIKKKKETHAHPRGVKWALKAFYCFAVLALAAVASAQDMVLEPLGGCAQLDLCLCEAASTS